MQIRRRLTSAIILSTLIFLVPGSAVTAEGSLDKPTLEQFQQDYEKLGDQQAIINSVTNNSLKSLSLNRTRLAGHDQLLSVKLDGSSIVNQKGSGRCWMFAGVNVFAPKILTILKTAEFEISEPYLTFWDKMEKGNYFLEEIIRTRDRKLSDRELEIIIDSPFGDGGWWHYFTDLIDKYGIVPISAMPETKQSTSTGMVNKLATTKLRIFAAELRQMHSESKSEKELRDRKTEMMSEIYRLLVYTYGPPPSEFRFRYESTDSTIQPEFKNYTPASFRDEALGDERPEYVAIINNPSRDYDRLYQLEGSRNLVEYEDLKVLNLSIDRVKEYCLKSILDSQAVWFACDVGEENYSDSGIFAVGIYDYQRTLKMNFDMSKRDRLAYKEVDPNHAMVLMGVDTTDAGAPRKWLVENSWGTKKGIDGYWYMYDDWFNEYVLMAIVDRRLLSDKDSKMFDGEAEPVPMWDPFFLALRNLK
ncbi:MAG: C1 family peptidase [bacterium]|nr:C1 family peptidase [bacterium]